MNRFYYFLSFIFLFAGCSNNTSQAEKNYIKNLEEKNILLEQELQELKGTPDKTKNSKTLGANTQDYFTIGSTEEEVIKIMGQPTAYMKTASEAKKFIYGYSTVYFYQGKVISYDNLDDNLKVKVK